MTALEIESLLAKGKCPFKFKSETGEIPKTIYDTVCSFLNRGWNYPYTVLMIVMEILQAFPKDTISHFISTFSTTVNNCFYY